MDLFIDTNIYLSFYHFTSDDLEELGKLAVIMAEGKVTLYVPDQVKDEFWRNREIKIANALKQLNEQKFNLQFPQLCKDYSEYDTLRNLQKEFEEVHVRLLEKLNGDISTLSLKADKTIAKLFEGATKIDNTEELIQKARLRNDTGKPPGNKHSFGDALNWEALLTNVPVSSDCLYFVSNDKHYCSPLNSDHFNEYLRREWEQTKLSGLHFYKQLSLFFKDKFPDIKLSDIDELEKEILVRRLSVSSSFSETHQIIAKLSTYSGFTAEQLNAILKACVSNFQVSYILTDEDILAFVNQFILGNREGLDPENLSMLGKLMQNKLGYENSIGPKENIEEETECPF